MRNHGFESKVKVVLTMGLFLVFLPLGDAFAQNGNDPTDGVDERHVVEPKGDNVTKQNDNTAIDNQDATPTHAGKVKIINGDSPSDFRLIRLFSQIFEPPGNREFVPFGGGQPDPGNHVDIVWAPSGFNPQAEPDESNRIQIEATFVSLPSFVDVPPVPAYPLKGEGNLSIPDSDSEGSDGGESTESNPLAGGLHWSAAVSRCDCTIDVCIIIFRGASPVNDAGDIDGDGFVQAGRLFECGARDDSKEQKIRRFTSGAIQQAGEIWGNEACITFNIRDIKLQHDILVDANQDGMITPNERQTINNGIASSNFSFPNDCLTLALVGGQIVSSDGRQPLGVGSAFNTSPIDAWIGQEGIISFCQNSTPSQHTADITIAHEVGHVLGLANNGHPSDPNNLMFFTLTQLMGTELTDDQIDTARSNAENGGGLNCLSGIQIEGN